ncbi:MAG: ATPase [Candidatus Eisenbacteria bacterium]|nr:ATPase [Candidatus Eisenbacteria bacterium]
MRLATPDALRRTLHRIDGRGYKAYNDLRGDYDFGLYRLQVEHIQADPFAPPSRIHVVLDHDAGGFAAEAQAEAPRRLALEDFLGRRLAQAVRGGGRFGFRVDQPGQQILKRTAVNLGPRELEARLGVELPAAGRRIQGRQAGRLLLEELPALVEKHLTRSGIDVDQLRRHQDVAEDHAALSAILARNGWIAFLAAGASLARRAGHDDRPLQPGGGQTVVPFTPPAELEAEVVLPHAGAIRGMAVPEGVTLLVGGGFHGKSTLLAAVALGIYPHIPGDGREQVATGPAAVKIRAEEGRAVSATDISPFIDGLPFGASTRSFTTQNASGSTSQAANIIEALEAGARALLIDEDSSATNFMIRDEPMRRLLRPGQEPITPFLERVRALHRDRGVSTILVLGGSGEYFKVADRVILMDHFRPHEVTGRAREIMAEFGDGGISRAGDPFPPAGARRLAVAGYGRGDRVKTKAVGTRRVVVDREEVDLESCEQLVSPSQVRTLAETLVRLLQADSPELPDVARGFRIPDLLEAWRKLMERRGLDGVCRFRRGDLAAVRAVDLAALVNRLRRMRGQGE